VHFEVKVAPLLTFVLNSFWSRQNDCPIAASVVTHCANTCNKRMRVGMCVALHTITGQIYGYFSGGATASDHYYYAYT